MIMFGVASEKFSQSGLSISDRYCDRLVDVYLDPTNNDPEARADYRRRVCGKQRRQTVEARTGNYFFDNGVLV